MATKGTRWVMDRSTDLVPTLLAMCAVEWWHGAAGLASRIDQRLSDDVTRTLAVLREELGMRREELGMSGVEHLVPVGEPAGSAA
jgi:hypothetical protein